MKFLKIKDKNLIFHKDILLEESLIGANIEFKHINEEKIISGIKYNYFIGIFTDVSALDVGKPKESGVMSGFNLEQPDGVSEYGYIFSGYLFVPSTGTYTFYLESNDGGRLFINGKELINNDGLHGAKEESGKINLNKGYYPILVKYFQAGGGQKLIVSWQLAGSKKLEITDENLFYTTDKK